MRLNFYFINLKQERLAPYIIIRRGYIYIYMIQSIKPEQNNSINVDK